MLTCDWCGKEDKKFDLFNMLVPLSEEYEDTKIILLCKDCRSILHKHLGAADYEAMKQAKAEVLEKKNKKNIQHPKNNQSEKEIADLKERVSQLEKDVQRLQRECFL